MAREHFQFGHDFRIQGQWRTPSGKHEPSGELTCEGGKLRLNLIGAFDDVEGDPALLGSFPVREPAVIHGTSREQTPITLLGSFYTSWTQQGLALKSPSPIAKSSLTCNAMLLGTHVEEEDAECFSQCSLVIPNLDRWLDDRPFSVDITKSMSIDVHYTMPETRRFCLADDSTTIAFVPSVIPPSDPWNSARVTHSTRVVIESSAPKDFRWFVRMAGETECLLTLLFGHAVQFTEMQLSCSGSKRVGSVYAYFQRARIDQPELQPIDFVCRYSDVEQYFPSIVSSWFTENDDVRHALDLVFSSLRQPGHFLETRFLPFVQALEVYARSTGAATLVPKSEYKTLRKQMVRAIPQDAPEAVRESITRSLNFANEPTLKVRIKELIDGLAEETRSLFSVDSEAFVRGVVDTRNHLVHYSGRSKAVLTGKSLHWATVKLQTLMKVLLLLKVGVPEDALLQMFSRNHLLAQERRAWQGISEVGANDESAD